MVELSNGSTATRKKLLRESICLASLFKCTRDEDQTPLSTSALFLRFSLDTSVDFCFPLSRRVLGLNLDTSVS